MKMKVYRSQADPDIPDLEFNLSLTGQKNTCEMYKGM